MTAAEFFSGKTTEPVYMDLNSKQKTDAPPAPTPAASTPQTPAKTPPASSEMAPETSRSSFPPNPVSAAEEPPVQTLASSSSPEDMGQQAQAKASTGDPAEAPAPASVKSAAREPAPSTSPAPPAPAAASASGGAVADDGQVDSLRDQVSKLESQLSERDSIIRTLELKVSLTQSSHSHTTLIRLFLSLRSRSWQVSTKTLSRPSLPFKVQTFSHVTKSQCILSVVNVL